MALTRPNIRYADMPSGSVLQVKSTTMTAHIRKPRHIVCGCYRAFRNDHTYIDQ